METSEKESVSERSSCDVETENLQSSPDSEHDDKSSEDSSRKDTSNSESDNSAGGIPSSIVTDNSSSDIQNSVKDLDLSASNEVASTGDAEDRDVQNPLNALALCTLPSNPVVIITTTQQVQENRIHSSRKMTPSLNISDKTVVGVETSNAGTKKVNTSTETEMTDFSKNNKNLPSDCSSSERNLAEPNTRRKSELPAKAFSAPKDNPRPIENMYRSNFKAYFDTQRNITTNRSTPPLTMAQNRASGTCDRNRYGETLENSNVARKDVIHSNLNTENFNRSRPEALKFHCNDDAITPGLANLRIKAEGPTSTQTRTEQGKSSSELSARSVTRASADYSNVRENNRHLSNLYVRIPRAIMKRFQDDSSHGDRNGGLLVVARDDRFSGGMGSDSSGNTDRNLPYFSSHRVSSTSEQVDSRDYGSQRYQSTDRNLRYNASYGHQSLQLRGTSSSPRGVQRQNPDSAHPVRQMRFSDDRNGNMSLVQAGAYAQPSIRPPPVPRADGQTLNGRTIHFSADCNVQTSVVPYSYPNGPSLSSRVIHFSSDYTVENNSDPYSYGDRSVSNSVFSNSSTFHERSVSNSSDADNFPQNDVFNNDLSNTFSDQRVLNTPVRRILSIGISHAFPLHPVINYYLFNDYSDASYIINITLTHLFSEIPVTNVIHSGLWTYQDSPTLFSVFPEVADRPVLHISLRHCYPEHLVLLGFSHNYSYSPFLHFTLADSFSGHPVFFTCFRLIPQSETYPGQPYWGNDDPHNLCRYRALVNAVPSDVSGSPILLNARPPAARALNQPRIPQFLSLSNFPQLFAHSRNYPNAPHANVVQQYPSQPSSNNHMYASPEFSNQPACSQQRLFAPQGYYTHYYPMLYNNFQYHHQPHYPQQAIYRQPREHDTDSDTDQGIYTDTDQEENAGQ